MADRARGRWPTATLATPTNKGKASFMFAQRLPKPIRLLAGLLVIFAFWAAGEGLGRIVPLPIPGSIVGMVLLAAALQLKLVPLAIVEEIGALVLEHMALFFVPLGVGLVRYTDVLKDEWLPITAGVIGSTLAVLIVVAWIQQRLEPGD